MSSPATRPGLSSCASAVNRKAKQKKRGKQQVGIKQQAKRCYNKEDLSEKRQSVGAQCARS